MTSQLPCIALCVEAPIALRGGVSVLIEALIEGLAADYRIVLVSPDTNNTLVKSPIHTLLSGHIPWNHGQPPLSACRDLALELKKRDVALVHFHSGNNSWRRRWTAISPVWFTRLAGIVTIATNHTAVHVWDNYCDPAKTSWIVKAAMLPFAWTGKMLFLACLETEIAVSLHNLDLIRRWYWPWKRFRLIYHSRISKIGDNTPPGDR
ncbi:MAG: glycosyltransferase, partial [Chthoniobacteraceae bacterium]